VVPSTRIPPVSWTFGGTTFTDQIAHTLTW
jgi:hypothetical protein